MSVKLVKGAINNKLKNILDLKTENQIKETH